MTTEAIMRIEQQLKAARQRLLDLTMRNRLLNFRPTKSGTLRVVDEIPGELLDLLVLSERIMEFLPKAAQSQEHSKGVEMPAENDGLTSEEEKFLWSVTDPPEALADRHTDKYLQTSLDPARLQRRLFFIQKKAQSALEEQGYSILYLAVGFLEWKESAASTQFRKAPLILIPVDLYRPRAGSSFRLRWTGEDLQTNISLQAKLKEQGVALPDFEMPENKGGVYSYFQEVTEATRREENWRVNSDIFLGFFSFTKFLMYKDLDPLAWPQDASPSSHPLIQSILNPQENESFGDGFHEEEIDQRLETRNIYHVLDADPSQIAVIEDVKASYNLAVEGPPGTGKSQTIANMIAELLGIGKSVLFVSEKMAALEVVKSRLDQVGLGAFSLELHSRKSKKKEVIEELQRCMCLEYGGPEYSETLAAELDTIKHDLNSYPEALRTPLGTMQRSPFSLFSTVERVRHHFEKVDRQVPGIPSSSNPFEWNNQQYIEARESFRDLADVLQFVQPLVGHPWRGCFPGLVLPADEAVIAEQISQLLDALSLLDGSLRQFSTDSGVKIAESILELPKVLAAAQTIADFPQDRIDRSVLLHEDWVSNSGRQGKELIGDLEAFQSGLKVVRRLFKSSILEQNIDSIVSNFKPRAIKLFRIFDSRYRMLRREIRRLYVGKPPRKNETMISDLEEVKNLQRLREKLAEALERGRAIFGDLWRGEATSTEELRKLAEWMPRFHPAYASTLLTDRAIEILEKSNGRKTKIEHYGKSVVENVELVQKTRDLCFDRLQVKIQTVFGSEDADSIPLVSLLAQTCVWSESIDRLQVWSRFLDLRGRCTNTIAQQLIDLVDDDRLLAPDVIPFFELTLAEAFLKEAFQQRPALSAFVGELHQKKIERFVTLDRRLIELNRTRLLKKLASQRPKFNRGAPSGSQLGILLGEFKRQRGLMPIRKLMRLTGPIIQKLKPCFMMSPMSIAQFLEPTTASFDVIIFDEASQVKPEDALGALLRGRQAVVVGDTKQLPPTSFFDLLVESDEREEEDLEEAYITDTESILHQCERCFPTRLLKWHYRSRHESLIAVSNQEFYDNALLFYPSPLESSPDLGVQFRELPDAVYDRGRSSVNRLEARAIAEYCVKHYREYPGKSLGVGTFNIKQQQAVWEEVELQMRRHPDIEEYFSSQREEHFFVGCAGFRVDLGVVNPELPGCYLVGIECDGAKFHTSAVARDRDRLRQQILEKMGWRILRVWSTDWYRNRRSTQDRLLMDIERARQSTKSLRPPSFEQQEAQADQSFSICENMDLVETDNLEDGIELYTVCSSLPFIPNSGIHECPTSQLVEVVCSVVSVEAPIHKEEVIRRIRSLWGVKRSGRRIQKALSDAIGLAVSLKKITRRKDFLWPLTGIDLKIRRRRDDPPPKIDLISEEEITQAIKLVLNSHFATPRDELVNHSARLFGIQAVHQATANRINSVVNELLREGLLVDTGGMLDLKSRG